MDQDCLQATRPLLTRASLGLASGLLRTEFGDPGHTDTIIHTGDKRIYAHRDVLKYHSTWFCDNLPSELDGDHHIYHIKPEKPGDYRNIEAMIRFMYGWRYWLDERDSDLDFDKDKLYELDIKMYILGQKYGFKDLCFTALGRFEHNWPQAYNSWSGYARAAQFYDDIFHSDFPPEHAFYRKTLAFLIARTIINDKRTEQFRRAFGFFSDIAGFLEPGSVIRDYRCVGCQKNAIHKMPYCLECMLCKDDAETEQTINEETEDPIQGWLAQDGDEHIEYGAW